jgi:hypothetical protein
MSLLRKSIKLSQYIRKFGTAEKIQKFVDKYLDPDNNKINIEHLLTTPSYFTYTAVVEHIRNNGDIYLNYGPDTVIRRAFDKLCKVYEEEPFFRIVRGDVFESKYEKPSFRKIKCVWFFHELLKILSDKENKGFTHNMVLDIFEDKVKRLQIALKKCRDDDNDIDFVRVLGVVDMDYRLLMGKKESSKRTGGKTRKRQRIRPDSI